MRGKCLARYEPQQDRWTLYTWDSTGGAMPLAQAINLNRLPDETVFVHTQPYGGYKVIPGPGGDAAAWQMVTYPQFAETEPQGQSREIRFFPYRKPGRGQRKGRVMPPAQHKRLLVRSERRGQTTHSPTDLARCFSEGVPMDISMTTTTFELHGYRVTRTLGVVRGITVRSRGFAGQLAAGLRSMVGGKIHEYVVMCEEARGEAFDLMMQHATELGANAVVGVRYDATELAESMTEVLAYGTAVVVEKI